MKRFESEAFPAPCRAGGLIAPWEWARRAGRGLPVLVGGIDLQFSVAQDGAELNRAGDRVLVARDSRISRENALFSHELDRPGPGPCFPRPVRRSTTASL